MILFLDLETTGLNHKTETILEVAAIMVRDDLTEVARFHRVTSAAQSLSYASMVPFVRDMHHANGLWMESLRADPTSRVGDVDRALADFIKDHVPDAGTTLENKTGPQLAGNTISFDRSFLVERMGFSAVHLHYRNIDVSSLNEMAKRFWPEVHKARPSAAAGAAHRAMPDVENSLALARYYARALTSTANAEELVTEAGALFGGCRRVLESTSLAGALGSVTAAIGLAPRLAAMARDREPEPCVPECLVSPDGGHACVR